mgnify:CR=1 FL=1
MPTADTVPQTVLLCPGVAEMQGRLRLLPMRHRRTRFVPFQAHIGQKRDELEGISDTSGQARVDAILK